MKPLLTHWAARSVLALALLSSSALAVTRSTSQRFAADQVATLRVRVDVHDVEVTVAPGQTVTVDLETSFSGVGLNPQAEVPRVTLQAGTLSVVSRPRTALVLGHLRGRLRVRLPPGKVLDLGTDSGHCQVSGAATGARLSCLTDSGDIDISAASTALTARSDSGRIEVSGFAPTLTLRTESGNVHVTAGGQVTASSDSGNLNFQGLSGTLSARSDSGGLSARWHSLPATGRLALQTDSGSIDARFPVDAKLGGSVRSESGTVSVGLPGVRTSDDSGTRINLGEAPLTLKVTSGSGNVLLGWDR